MTHFCFSLRFDASDTCFHISGSHDFLSIFVRRICQLVVLELSSLLPFRACFGFEYLGELFLSSIILLVDELVLVEIQYIRVERPVVPIFEHTFVAEAH